MKLNWQLSKEDEDRRMVEYREGKDPLKFKPRPSFFMPDSIENINHDAKPTENMTVFTQDGVAVCGRVVGSPSGHWIATLQKEYFYK
jgi:hypothetical protein